MKKYQILDTETTRDFAPGFAGDIYELIRVEGDMLVLDTVDGELYFAADEVEEVQ